MENSSGVGVILDDLESNPACPHGPTILFKRLSDGKDQKFYACSACRDRKDCDFFLKHEDSWTDRKKEVWKIKKENVLPKVDHLHLIGRLKKVLQLPQKDRLYCHTCDLLLLLEDRSSHSTHDLAKHVSNHQLSHPSELLKPKESSKKEAQYLFAKKSTQVIVNMLRSAGVRNVVCVGAPRIHEFVRENHSSDMSSMLLDFDHRYHQFYDETNFAWFNAFNCHWFLGERSKAATLHFMQQGMQHELAIVTDPPFGGRVEPLVHTFQSLDSIHKNLHKGREGPLSLMWIFPYFMEPMITSNCSGMVMLDYKVDYDNHPLFQDGKKGRKFGSPVRVFTNISPSKLPLPQEEGYWFCDLCERWMSAGNKHCYKCGICTSKDGRTYVHCDKCSRCVKPTWRHCKDCQRCSLPDHKCGDFKPSVCFACRMPGHKKNECPLRMNTEDENSANRKRRKSKSNKRGPPNSFNSVSDEESSINVLEQKTRQYSFQKRKNSAIVKDSTKKRKL